MRLEDLWAKRYGEIEALGLFDDLVDRMGEKHAELRGYEGAVTVTREMVRDGIPIAEALILEAAR